MGLLLSMPSYAFPCHRADNTSKYVLCGKKGSTLSKDTIGIYIIIKGLPSQITSRTSVFWINCAMIAGFCRPYEEENISFFCWWQGWCSFYALFYLFIYVYICLLVGSIVFPGKNTASAPVSGEVSCFRRPFNLFSPQKVPTVHLIPIGFRSGDDSRDDYS